MDIRPQTLFRCGLLGEQHGPLISQFFIRDIPYGTQRIDQSQVPYKTGLDFLTTWEDWYRAQNEGHDTYGRDYGKCNFYADKYAKPPVQYYENDASGNPGRRMISTLRDLARFVNRDALHQAYFNAALFLDAVEAPLDAGNPYGKSGALAARELGFATLGGPDLLTLVSEVASRALKVVWRQKWFVHRRARPEVYGGLLHAQEIGVGSEKTQTYYGLPSIARDSVGGKKVLGDIKGYFLPIAFSAGSPVHPAYGAGHATVAGACVTVLKAWFDEDASIEKVFSDASKRENQKEPPLRGAPPHKILIPIADPASFGDPVEYLGEDRKSMTIGGELNKLASNVAMGRSMGGVHWRSDNTRSLRLGERVAIEILRKRTLEYAEPNVSFTFTSFDGKTVKIQGGKVSTS